MDKLKISFLSRPGLSVQMVTMEITTQSQTVSKKSATSPPHKCAYIINYYYLHMKQFLRGSGYRRRSWALTRYVPACLLNSNSELTTNPLTFLFFCCWKYPHIPPFTVVDWLCRHHARKPNPCLDQHHHPLKVRRSGHFFLAHTKHNTIWGAYHGNNDLHMTMNCGR